MGRIFSIDFDYEGIGHTAMVSVRTTPFFTEYSISMLNEEIMQQLPGNKIVSTGPNQLFFMNSDTGEQSPLMDAILNAVSVHLQSSPV